jgi:hypothetical protein
VNRRLRLTAFYRARGRGGPESIDTRGHRRICAAYAKLPECVGYDGVEIMGSEGGAVARTSRHLPDVLDRSGGGGLTAAEITDRVRREIEFLSPAPSIHQTVAVVGATTGTTQTLAADHHRVAAAEPTSRLSIDVRR